MERQIISRKEALEQGLKFYFTGVPCANGHLCERDVAEWRCLECRRAKATRKRKREAVAFNAERRLKYATDTEHRENIKQKTKQWRLDNPERAKERSAKWKAANRDHVLARKKANNTERRAKSEVREREKETSLAWKKANPTKVLIHSRNRRALRRNAEGTHTEDDIAAIWVRQEGLCVYCSADLLVTDFHVDHIIPLSKGGSNWPFNLQCLCPDCNLRKWNLSEEEFLSKQKGPH